MTFAEFRSFVIRHRVTIQDLAVLIAGLAVATFVVFEVDVFENEGAISRKQETIELDEILLLGAILTIGLLIFSIRRYLEQKKETQRRIELEQHARRLAFQDALTGLANRRKFDDALKAAIAAPPRAGAAHALFLLDLNGFKHINDVYGHGTGDELLIVIAQRLRSAAREGDVVARFGGDEFAILSEQLVGPEAAANIALRVIHALQEEIAIGGIRHRIGAGIGITLLPQDANTGVEALRKADVALYRAKAERRSAMRFFEEDMDRLIREREQMEQELRTAVADGDIHIFYQPSVDLKTREIVSFEAVPRWLNKDFGEVPLERFIPIAEETGLIHELADQFLKEACAAAALWPEHVGLSINVFPGQLTGKDLGPRILSILAESNISPKRIEFEITEDALVRDLEAAQAVFGVLREHGAQVALDNFGTGYSSLYHLRNFKLDKIKLDRSFTTDVRTDGENSGIVRALIGLGHGLGLKVSAEGIADAEQGAVLLGHGCEEGQGDLFSDPLPASAATALVKGSSDG